MQRIKEWVESTAGKDILTIMVVIFVGLVAFMLGRLSKDSPERGIRVEYKGQAANTLSAVELLATHAEIQVKSRDSRDKSFFASRRGKKYYPVGCSAGANIKMENRIYFSSAYEAESRGYSLSSSCK